MKYKLNTLCISFIYVQVYVCVCLTDVQAFLFFNQNTRVNVLNVLHLMPLKDLIIVFKLHMF